MHSNWLKIKLYKNLSLFMWSTINNIIVRGGASSVLKIVEKNLWAVGAPSRTQKSNYSRYPKSWADLKEKT